MLEQLGFHMFNQLAIDEGRVEVQDAHPSKASAGFRPEGGLLNDRRKAQEVGV
jgi:hypothetical protein